MLNSIASKRLVEKHQKHLFAFILSFAAFSREQAFEITTASFTRSLDEIKSTAGDDAFLEVLFRNTLREIETIVPAGNAELTAFGEFPPQSREPIKIVREALIHLSREDKTVLLLRDQCHFSNELIASILSTDPRQTKSACLAARERLRSAVQDILEKRTG